MAIIHTEDYGQQKSSPRKTHVCFLLDESASMSTIASQVISGFNEYIRTLRSDIKDVGMTLVKFNTPLGVDMTYIDASISDLPTLDHTNYRPSGMTPLYDAIGVAINQMGDKEHVLFVIQTDGEENASKEYTLDAVKHLIKSREEIGWTIVYMGADQNAWEAGGKTFGIARGNTLSYGSSDTHDTLATNLAKSTVSYHFDAPTNRASSTFFSNTSEQ